METSHDAAEKPQDAVEAPPAEAGEAPDGPGTIRIGPDAQVFQISINVSFPFSSIVIPAGKRAGGRFLEIARHSIPALGKPEPPEREPNITAA